MYKLRLVSNFGTKPTEEVFTVSTYTHGVLFNTEHNQNKADIEIQLEFLSRTAAVGKAWLRIRKQEVML